MTDRILLLASHAVAEYDDLRMFTDLGYDVFAPGGYEVPSRSGEGIRPALPDAPHHPELVARLRQVREERGEPGPAIDWGKAALHDDIIDWADVIIVHHFPQVWIAGQWDRIKHKRVIWRTCGQSNPDLERHMGVYVAHGLQIVRYSPAERRYFESLGPRCFAGQDALIRFGKYPDDYGPWDGDQAVVGNVTQDMQQRGDSCGLSSWLNSTIGLPARPAGKGSEALPGGIGQLSYEDMLDYLRHIRVYLYTGTRPASYTLGLIEAMLSGVPVVSIGPAIWGNGWDGGALFEGHEIAYSPSMELFGGDYDPNDRRWIRLMLEVLLSGRDEAREARELAHIQRSTARTMFDVATVGAQWQEFLG